MRIPGFKVESSAKHGNYQGVTETGVYVNGEIEECSMKPSQREVYDGHMDDSFCRVSKPPGSGKSMTMKFVHGHNLSKNLLQKLIITIPQNSIAKTFRGIRLQYDDGTVLPWNIKNDFCKDSPDAKIDSLLNFIKCKDFAKGIEQRICLCTHASLRLAWKILREECSDEELEGCLDNTTVVIDEAHHILSTEGDASLELRNEIGKFVHFMVRHRDNIKNGKLWFLTATWFRGDGLSILPPEDAALFTHYCLSLDRHWHENFQHIEDYAYNFVTYESNPFEEVVRMIRENKLKTIIYCPKAGSYLANLCANGCKLTFSQRLREVILKEWPEARILDLVDESGREDRKNEMLMDTEKAKDTDVILTISMMDEGVDWDVAEQILDLAPSNSLRIVVQRFGRLLRDIPGKKHLYYNTFLSFIEQGLDREKTRRTLCENFTALNAALLLEELIQPVNIGPVKKGKKDDGSTINRVNWFQEEVPDENDRQAILSAVQGQLLVLKAQEEIMGFDDKIVKEAIIKILEDCGVKNVESVSRQIVAMFRRRTLSYGVDVSWMVDAGFEKIWDGSIVDNLLGFVSGSCGLNTFEEFNRIYGSLSDIEFADALKKAETFSQTHDGPPKWDSDDPEEREIAKWWDRTEGNGKMRDAPCVI